MGFRFAPLPSVAMFCLQLQMIACANTRRLLFIIAELCLFAVVVFFVVVVVAVVCHPSVSLRLIDSERRSNAHGVAHFSHKPHAQKGACKCICGCVCVRVCLASCKLAGVNNCA